MDKDYWIDRTTRKDMSGIKRTMEALKYIAWAEILFNLVRVELRAYQLSARLGSALNVSLSPEDISGK